MAAVYSTLMLEAQGANFSVLAPVVPVGLVWIVRDISAYTYALPGAFVGVLDNISGSYIWAMPALIAIPGFAQWHGRQVLPAGRQLRCFAAGGSVVVRISGYALSAP